MYITSFLRNKYVYYLRLVTCIQTLAGSLFQNKVDLFVVPRSRSSDNTSRSDLLVDFNSLTFSSTRILSTRYSGKLKSTRRRITLTEFFIDNCTVGCKRMLCNKSKFQENLTYIYVV